MTIEICARCGRTRDDADDLAFDDEWMPIFGPSGRREDVVCPGCELPQDQAALEAWVDAFDKQDNWKFALAAAVRNVDRSRLVTVLQAHEHFGALFLGVDLQRLNVSQVDHWITAWTRYNELARLPATDLSIRSRAIELTRLLLALEQAKVVPDGAAHVLAFAYGITCTDLAPDL